MTLERMGLTALLAMMAWVAISVQQLTVDVAVLQTQVQQIKEKE
jgi:hypothetical protein